MRKLILVILLSFYACEFRSSDENVLNASKRIVAIEARKLKDGPTAGQGGDVVVVDMETGRKFYVTNDYYINRNPQWSPGGKSVIYLTNREGNSRWSRNFLAEPHQNKLYRFNTEDKKLVEIFYDYEGKKKKSNIYSLFWSRCNDLLYFKTSNYRRDSHTLISTIYKLSSSGGLAEKIVELEDSPNVRNFVVANSGNAIVYAFSRWDRQQQNYIGGMNIYNVAEKSSINLFDTPGYSITDVSRDGMSVLISDAYNVYEYDVVNYALDTLLSISPEFIHPIPKYIDREEIAMFVHRPVEIYPDNYVVELIKYNRSTNEIEKMSDRKNMWIDMSVYAE